MKKHIDIKEPPLNFGKRDGLITVEYVRDNPRADQVPDGKLIVVGVKNRFAKWAYMKCPSGCGDTIMLSLQRGDDPRWRLTIDEDGLPSLYPSVWKLDGCRSHFILRNGKVIKAVERRRYY